MGWCLPPSPPMWRPLTEWLGARMTAHIARIFHRPIRILGSYSQFMHNNWKLYMENVKDTYHASILHLFLTTFGLNRLSMEGGLEISPCGGHHLSWSKRTAEQMDGTEYAQGTMRAMQKDFQLADPRLLQTWPEFPDGDHQRHSRHLSQPGGAANPEFPGAAADGAARGRRLRIALAALWL